MTARVTVWNKQLSGYSFQVKEPLRPFFLSYLAATGMFDKIVIEKSDGLVIECSGADLLLCADMVSPKSAEERA